jgi:prophage regulatory protein
MKRKPKPPPTPDRILRIEEVAAMLAISRRSVYGLLDEDPAFPKPVRIGARSIGWRLSDVLGYIAALPSIRPKRRTRAKSSR